MMPGGGGLLAGSGRISRDENDVLGRFRAAADLARADVIVRDCADNPFIAPEEIDRIVEHYRSLRPDYAFNHVPRLGNEYADGFGAEVIGRALLDRLNVEAREPRHREHVTVYVWEHPAAFPHLDRGRARRARPSRARVRHRRAGRPRWLEPFARSVGIDGTAAEIVRAKCKLKGRD